MLRLLPIMLDYASCELVMYIHIICSINCVYSFELVPLTMYTTVYGFNYNPHHLTAPLLLQPEDYVLSTLLTITILSFLSSSQTQLKLFATTFAVSVSAAIWHVILLKIMIYFRILYSSKFLWSNIFVIFMNYTEIMKISATKISLHHP